MQYNFIDLLNKLVAGVEYDELNKPWFPSRDRFHSVFSDLLKLSHCCIQRRSYIDDNNVIRVAERISRSCLWSNSSPFEMKHRFHKFLNSLVGYSLTNFLSNNDRRKLKLCPYCDKFYIADDIRQKKCKNEECRKQYEREKKRKQRKNDPVKYY